MAAGARRHRAVGVLGVAAHRGGAARHRLRRRARHRVGPDQGRAQRPDPRRRPRQESLAAASTITTSAISTCSILESPTAAGIIHATDEADERVSDIVEAIAAQVPQQPDIRIMPMAEARKKLGTYADALALDQKVRSPKARALGWAPTQTGVDQQRAAPGRRIPKRPARQRLTKHRNARDPIYCSEMRQRLDRSAALLVLAIGCSKPAPPPPPPAGPAEDQITTESLTNHIKVLASDEFEGRAPATPGGEKTAGLPGQAAERAWHRARRARRHLLPAGADRRVRRRAQLRAERARQHLQVLRPTSSRSPASRSRACRCRARWCSSATASTRRS